MHALPSTTLGSCSLGARDALGDPVAMATRAQLVEALLELPAPDRAEVARTLLESLDREDADDPVDVDTAASSR